MNGAPKDIHFLKLLKTLPMKHICITLFSLWLAISFTPGSAQEADSTVFRQHVVLTISPAASMNTLQQVFQYWTQLRKFENSQVHLETFWFPSDLYLTPGYGVHIPTVYSSGLSDQCMKALKQEFLSRTHDADSIAREKRRITASLEAMDTLLHNKPLCFQVINTSYKGSISRYVDDLYARSFMTSKRRFRRMLRRRNPRLLVKDLGVNYAISMALYEAWIRQRTDSVPERF